MRYVLESIAAKAALSIAVVITGSITLTAQTAANSKESSTTAAPTGQTQTVNAVQSGLWTIGVDPAKNSVRVANPESDPVPVKVVSNGPARQPFQRRIVVTIPAGYGVGSTQLHIPYGKRLTIENISAVARVPAGMNPYLQLLTFFDSGDGVFDPQDIAYHRLALVSQGDFYGNITSTANHKVLIFADEKVASNTGMEITFSFGVSGTVSQPATAEYAVSGYIEDKPTP